MTRSTMLEELGKDYVQTHRSQGLTERNIIVRYTLKNAMIPTLTIASLRLAMLLGGTAVIESVFGWPGIGLMILDGILTRDDPVVQGGILVPALSAKEMRKVRGQKVAMIFQEPMTSLNPVFTIGSQMADAGISQMKSP